MTDLMEQVRAALGGQTPMLLPECHPLPPEVAARFGVYAKAQHERAVEHAKLVERSEALTRDIREAKELFFAFLREAMPELAGKAVHLNPDGTYQLFAEIKPEESHG